MSIVGVYVLEADIRREWALAKPAEKTQIKGFIASQTVRPDQRESEIAHYQLLRMSFNARKPILTAAQILQKKSDPCFKPDRDGGVSGAKIREIVGLSKLPPPLVLRPVKPLVLKKEPRQLPLLKLPPLKKEPPVTRENY